MKSFQTKRCVHTLSVCSLFKKMARFVFDYGNNLREGARLAGLENAFDFPGFVPAYIRAIIL